MPRLGPSPYAWAPTHRLPRAKPPVPVLGPAGCPFIDPTFGAQILRVTDETVAAGASWHVPSNAHLAAWNADSTLFYVVGAAGKRLYRRDGSFVSTFTSQPEAQFSRVDPDVLFVGGGPIARTLQRYSLSKKTYTNVFDLDALELPTVTPRTYIGGIGSSAAPEVVVVFFGGEEADRHRYVLWLPLDGRPRKILDTQKVSAPTPYLLHSVSVDMTGRYVLLYPTASLSPAVAKKIIWDTTTDVFTLLPEGSARMGGHDALGYGCMINMEGASATQPYDDGQWVFRQLATPFTMTDEVSPVLTPKEVSLEDHTSWNNAQPDRLTPVLSSTFHSGPITLWRAWDDELLLIDPGPASDVIRRVMHTRCVITPDFWTQPIANISPDGTRALVHTTWEDTLGVDPSGGFRRDVFLVALAR